MLLFVKAGIRVRLIVQLSCSQQKTIWQYCSSSSRRTTEMTERRRIDGPLEKGLSTVREITDALSAPSPCPLPGVARGHRTVISRTVLTAAWVHPLARRLRTSATSSKLDNRRPADRVTSHHVMAAMANTRHRYVAATSTQTRLVRLRAIPPRTAVQAGRHRSHQLLDGNRKVRRTTVRPVAGAFHASKAHLGIWHRRHALAQHRTPPSRRRASVPDVHQSYRSGPATLSAVPRQQAALPDGSDILGHQGL